MLPGRSFRHQASDWQGALALMVLKTLDSLGSLRGCGIARRIEQTEALLSFSAS
jgi:hypothetical protein